MEPEELESKLMTADLCGGELPRWHSPEAKRHEPSDWEKAREKEIDAMLDEVRRQNNPHWDPEAIRRAADEADEEERQERLSRRARRRSRGRAR